MGDFNIILNQPATQPPPIQRYDLQGASSYYAYEENGRSYHAYKPGIYPYPADECERNRCDMLHHLVHGIILGHWTRRDGLAAAVARPLVQQSADSILDLGCGSGNWVIDMADQFPDAEVVGVDLVGGQPKDTPRITWRTPDSGSNNPLDFDGDQDWGFLGNTFDLIHAAHLCGGISDWSAFFRKIRKYLRPRSGQVELIEIDLEPRCDDGTLPRDSALYEWWRMMLEAGRRSGKSIAYPHNTGGLLQDARFADIKHQEHQLPFSFSANWVRPGMKTRAEWYNIMVTDPGDRYDPVATFNAYSMALFTRYLGLSRAQVDDLVARVSLDVSNPNYHIFHVLHVWTARRPGSDESHL